MLVEKIKADSVSARKAALSQDRYAVVTASLLQTLLGEAMRVGKDASPPRDPTDDEVLAVIRKFKKNAEETLSLSKSEKSINEIKIELSVLSHYLPKELSEDEVRQALRVYSQEIGRELTVKDTGAATVALNEKYPGQVTSKIVSIILREK